MIQGRTKSGSYRYATDHPLPSRNDSKTQIAYSGPRSVRKENACQAATGSIPRVEGAKEEVVPRPEIIQKTDDRVMKLVRDIDRTASPYDLFGSEVWLLQVHYLGDVH